MQTDTPVFDASRPIAINLRTPDGVKAVRVRFPSDDEWTARLRRRKVIVKNLGRGMSETTVAGGEEVDAALVPKIRAQEENRGRGGRPRLMYGARPRASSSS